MTLKRTPLYDAHKELGGKLVPFAGWELPVQYSSIIAEHQAVRNSAGLFDVSHMGELLFLGPQAEKSLQYMTCNDLSRIADGKGQYNAITNPQGGIVDDIIVYRMSHERFFVCLNASNAEKDYSWFSENSNFDVRIENISSHYGQLALQGPRAKDIIKLLTGGEQLDTLSYFSFVETKLESISVIVARTGYSGEDGYEIFVPWDHTVTLWEAILQKGKHFGVIPAGLGARDSLRLEACYPLHGHELADDISAIESGLQWIVKPEKGSFIGDSVLKEQIQHGAPRTLVGFFVNDAGIARHADPVFSTNGEQIGFVTSGTKTPTLQRSLGLALVQSEYAKVGTQFEVEVRGKKLRAEVVKKPFYKKPQ